MENLQMKQKINVYDYNYKTVNEFRALMNNGLVNLNGLNVHELHYLICQNCIKTTEITIEQLVEQYSRGYLVLEELNADQLLDLLKYM